LFNPLNGFAIWCGDDNARQTRANHKNQDGTCEMVGRFSAMREKSRNKTTGLSPAEIAKTMNATG